MPPPCPASLPLRTVHVDLIAMRIYVLKRKLCYAQVAGQNSAKRRASLPGSSPMKGMVIDPLGEGEDAGWEAEDENWAAVGERVVREQVLKLESTLGEPLLLPSLPCLAPSPLCLPC